MMRRHPVVRVAWDDEAKVWYVEDSDIQGSATEADTLETPRERIKVITADLLSDGPNHPDDMELDVIAYAHDRLHLEV